MVLTLSSTSLSKTKKRAVSTKQYIDFEHTIFKPATSTNFFTAAGHSTLPANSHRQPMPTFEASLDFFKFIHRELFHKLKLHTYKDSAFYFFFTDTATTEKILNKL